MGWPAPVTWPQFRCMMIFQRVKAGENLDLDMDGYVPKEKQEEWERILAELPFRRLENTKLKGAADGRRTGLDARGGSTVPSPADGSARPTPVPVTPPRK